MGAYVSGEAFLYCSRGLEAMMVMMELELSRYLELQHPSPVGSVSLGESDVWKPSAAL